MASQGKGSETSNVIAPFANWKKLLGQALALALDELQAPGPQVLGQAEQATYMDATGCHSVSPGEPLGRIIKVRCPDSQRIVTDNITHRGCLFYW